MHDCVTSKYEQHKVEHHTGYCEIIFQKSRKHTRVIFNGYKYGARNYSDFENTVQNQNDAYDYSVQVHLTTHL